MEDDTLLDADASTLQRKDLHQGGEGEGGRGESLMSLMKVMW